MGVRECSTETDILIIGGGSAGAMAAIWAKTLDPAQRVVVFDKSDVLYSGSIPRGMDALNVVAVPGLSTPEEYLEAVQIGLEGIIDDPPSYAMISRTWDLVQKLEDWGVYFPKDREGRYQVLDSPPKGKFCLAMQEPGLKVKLARRMESLGCRIFNRTMGLDLLASEGRVVGAVGLNIRTGGLVVCSAKTVILACGGTARFGQTTNGYPYGTFDFPGNTGEGYAMAYRAGAELTGFEYTIVDYSVKDVNVAGLHIALTRGAEVFDAFDQPLSTLSLKRMLAEHEAGRGPLHVKMQHLPEEKIAEIEGILFTTERPVQQRFFEGRGINFRKDDIEQWPSECFLCGGHGLTGIRVDNRAASSVPGLYAAGDVANLRGFLPGALVMGEIAAENATAFARTVPRGRTLDQGRVAQARKKLASLEDQRGPVSVQEFESKVRRMISDYISPPKNSYKLGRALEWMDRFKRELSQVVGIRERSDVYKCLEIESIITSAVLSATASEARKESRWGMWHYRTDYPERDDEHWLKHVILQKGRTDDDVRVSFKPIERMLSA